MDATKINEMLALWVDTLKEGKTFVLEQAPTLFQQKVQYEIIANAFCATSLLGLALLFSAGAMYCAIQRRKVEACYIGEWLAAGTLSWAAAFTTAAVLMHYMLSTIKWWLAPNVQLLEWLLGLAASSK